MTIPVYRIVGSLMLLIGLLQGADNYCSLVVGVQRINVSEEALVTVEEEDGTTQHLATSGGEAKFCNLGIRPVLVTVGRPGCNQVIVKDVQLNWNYSRRIRVIYDQSGCNVDAPPVAACAFLFRFVDSGRQPVRGVALRTREPFPGVYSADEYGRIFLRIAAGQELVGEGSAPSYQVKNIRTPCVSKNVWFEQIVVLPREGAR